MFLIGTNLIDVRLKRLRLRPWTRARRGWANLVRRSSLVLLTILPFLAGGASGVADDKPVIQEYQLKAAFLPKLPMFVEWPARDAQAVSKELVIGVLGDNPFGNHLETASRGKTAAGRSLSIKLCRTLDDAKTCQMVFIAASEKARLPAILHGLTTAGVLTVSDLPAFAESGGMVGLVADDRKIHMEINVAAARRAGLKIDPRLLKMAKVIQSETPASRPGS